MYEDELTKIYQIHQEITRLLMLCEKAKNKINKALGMGIVDIIGGGFFISLLKRNMMSNASDDLKELQDELKHFRHILGQNHNLSLDNDLEVTGLDYAFDILFDNPIYDFMSQRNMRKTLDSVNDLIDKLNLLKEELNKNYTFLD